MSDNDRMISATRVIDAPASKIFDLLADPSRHCEIDGSETVQASRGEPTRLAMGSKFGMKMTFSLLPYVISNTVVEFEENRLIAWKHFGGHRWRYELEEVDGGTQVTETFDWSTALVPKFIELVGYPKAHQGNIEKTLERLDAVVTSET